MTINRRRFMATLPVLGAVAEYFARTYSIPEISRAVTNKNLEAPDSLYEWTRRFLGGILTNQPSEFHL